MIPSSRPQCSVQVLLRRGQTGRRRRMQVWILRAKERSRYLRQRSSVIFFRGHRCRVIRSSNWGYIEKVYESLNLLLATSSKGSSVVLLPRLLAVFLPPETHPVCCGRCMGIRESTSRLARLAGGFCATSLELSRPDGSLRSVSSLNGDVLHCGHRRCSNGFLISITRAVVGRCVPFRTARTVDAPV